MLTAIFKIEAEAINYHSYLSDILIDALGQPDNDGAAMFEMLASNKTTQSLATDSIKFLKSWKQSGQLINLQSDIESWIVIYHLRKRS